jgi:spermidine synthase
MGRAKYAAAAVRPLVRLEEGRKVLRVGGVIQSVGVDAAYVPDVWDAMLPLERPHSALILGLGGGTIATLMTRRWGPLPIVGVEHDAAVAWLARSEFGLDALPNVEVCVADAFTYMHRCARRFDAICVDLFVAGHMTHGVLASSFLRDITRLLTPSGSVTFNLWRSAALEDQTRRLARHLHVLCQTTVDDNIVVRCVRHHRPLLPGEV